MSKVGGALPSWYWPVGIPRRVPVVQQPLSKVLRQRLTAAAAKPAVVRDDLTLSGAELLEQVQGAAGGLQASACKGPFAVLDPDPLESLVLLLAGLFAGRQIFLPEGDDRAEQLASRIAEARIAATLTSGGPGQFAAAGLETIRRTELSGAYNGAAGPKRAVEPAVLLSSRGGVVSHSHFSLCAMAASMAAFIPELREMAFVWSEPALGSWEALTGILLALLHGMPIVFAGLDDSSEEWSRRLGRSFYLIMRRRRADAMLVRGRAASMVAGAKYVFVSTGCFDSRWRTRLENDCGRPIFTLWGLPELGPVVAPHPTWLPPHGHGFPLVNVSLVPLDPGSGRVSIVPWEMLEQAEMGVEALSAMLGYAEAERNVGIKSGTALRTRQIASMDHVGVVVLHHDESAGGDGAGG
jgi:hypothetical protein